METSIYINKPAITNHDIHPLIKQRWSPRSFDPNRQVEQVQIWRFIEAARWAPSAFNEQPWRFIIGQKGDQNWAKLIDTMVEFNQRWAKNADVLVLAMGKKTLTKNGKPNGTFRYDVGGSMAYLTFQAVADGLMTHQMGGFSKEKAIEAFDIDEDLEPLTIIAIGHQDDADKLDDDMRETELSTRTRIEAELLVLEGYYS